MTKKAIFILLNTFVSVNIAFAHFTPTCIKDSTIEYKWNGNSWYSFKKTYHAYDSIGNSTREESLALNESTLLWEKIFLTEKEYNLSSKITQEISSTWDENIFEWVPQQKNIFNYMEDTFLLLRISYDYNGGWVGTSKTEYTNPNDPFTEIETNFSWYDNNWIKKDTSVSIFNSNGQKIKYENYLYDTSLSTWVGNNKQESTFNSFNMISSSVSYEWNGGVWKNSSKYEYNYNTDSLVSLSQNLQWVLNSWVNFSKNEYEYSNKLTIKNLQFKWEVSQWDSTLKYLYSYDQNGNIESSEIYSYLSSTPEWIGISKSVKTYNSDNFITQTKNLKWDNTLKSWVEGVIKINYSYDVSNKLISLKKAFWNSTFNNWVNNSLNLYTFNENGKQTLYQVETWDNTNGEWIAIRKDSSLYDSYNNEIGESSFLWDNLSKEWVPEHQLQKYLFSFSLTSAKITLCEDEETTIVTNKTYPLTYNWSIKNVEITNSNYTKLNAKIEGQYSLIAFDNNCIYTSNALDISVFQQPSTPIIYNVGNQIITTPLEDSIVWYFENEPIQSNTNSITIFKNGVYNISSTNEHNCTSYSDKIEINSIYAQITPSLTKDFAQIYFKTPIANIEVFSETGRLVQKYNNVSSGSKLDFTTLSNGYYFIHLTNGEFHFKTTLRLLKL